MAGLPDFDSLWDYDDPAATERAFRDLLPAARESGDSGYLAELMTQIARTEGLQGRFDEARRTLDAAESLLPDQAPRPRIRLLLERGRVLNSAGNAEAAKPLFVDAWNSARESGEDALAIDAAHMLAIVEPPDQQLIWGRRAVDVAESTDDPRAREWRASLYHNLGWTYHGLGKYEDALRMFIVAQMLRERTGKPREIHVARWCVARALRSVDRLDDALMLQRALLMDLEAKGETDGFVYEELGECLHALGRTEEARPFFNRAYSALARDPWLVEHEPARLERLKTLGDGG